MQTQKDSQAMETREQKAKAVDAPSDLSHDVILTDEDGDRIAAMREYVFLNLATSCN